MERREGINGSFQFFPILLSFNTLPSCISLKVREYLGLYLEMQRQPSKSLKFFLKFFSDM